MAKLPLPESSSACWALELPLRTETITPVTIPAIVIRMKAMTINSTKVNPF